LSLASRHKTTQHNIPPAPNWYKKVASSFKLNLKGDEGKKKIGLVWAGAPNHPGDHLRSIPLEVLLPLTGNDQCDFYSMQAGKRVEDIKKCGAEPLIKQILSLVLWPQTCAAMMELDALVTVDTACAHMAGSLGVKTFLMVSTESDWRWERDTETTPWYPSIKIIRQPSSGDWRGVVRRVESELEALCDEKAQAA